MKSLIAFRTAVATAACLLSLSTATLAADTLTSDQVKAKLEAAGYTNIQNIRREAKHYDAKAMKDGQEVYLDVDAKTGAISTESEESEEKEHQEKNGSSRTY